MSSTMRIIPIQLATEGRDGKIQPRSVSGRFARWRWAVVGLTQLLYYGLPWLSLNGRQGVLFDLAARRFYIFDAVFYPQDLIYLTGLLVMAALLLFFVTAVAGRFWCGFACPQTVYTSLFMWIEQRFEGSRQQRLRLDASPWGWGKLWRRGGKHLVWVLVAGWTGLTLVGYFTPVRDLLAPASSGAWGPWALFWTGFYGLATYVHAGLLREKVCLHMCPYGRFQGSLMDANTLNVAYDLGRGEPRERHATRAAVAKAGQGDCIDCTLCVQVCPTGIDIRKGLQAACIGCGLCIDACNDVMDKLARPQGLIRLASQAELAGTAQRAASPWRALWRPRVLVYGALLGVTGAALALGFAHRPELRLNVMRDRAVMARQVAHGEVENVYRLQVMNATQKTQFIEVQLADKSVGLSIASPVVLTLQPAQALTWPVTVRMAAEPAAQQAGRILPLDFALTRGDEPLSGAASAHSTFMVPR